MRIFGIDPGYERLGLTIIERAGAIDTVLSLSCLRTPKTKSHEERLILIGNHVSELIAQWHPDAIALEKLFFSTNVKTALLVAEVRGVLRYVATLHHIRLFEYSPAEVKIAVTGHGRSDKRDVEKMVNKLIHIERSDVIDDEFDAVAIALTCLAIDGKTVAQTLSTTPVPIAKKNDSGKT
jgi:crossover junction endodeoxyribonuclease RuvC